MALTPFHIAVQVRDINEAREFYGAKMGLPEGRSSADWIDFDLFGHQFVVHLNRDLGPNGSVRSIANAVDGHGVPVPHCGVVMQFSDWEAFALRARDFVDEFVIEPIRIPNHRQHFVITQIAICDRLLNSFTVIETLTGFAR